jgi:tetratricopeptide (TPR) repeat protein
MAGIRAVSLSLTLATVSFLMPGAGWAQTPQTPGQRPQPAVATPETDKSAAYYHYSLGHMYAELAATYNNRGDYFTKAIENYRLAMKDDPSASYVGEELSDLYIQSGRLREAVTEAEDVLKQNPNDLNARRILARIYARLIGESQQNKIDENYLKKALEQYQKIADGDPKDTDAFLMLGRLQKLAQNSTEAEKAYKRALEIDPDNEDALTGLAMVYVDLGDTKAAAAALKRVTDKNPSGRTLAALASTYEQMREYSLAAETLKKAVEMAPGNPELQRALAQNLLLADQLDDALKIYQQLVTEDPKDIQSELRISQIYRQKRDFPKAQAAAAKAKEMDPSNLEVRYNEVNLLEAEGKTNEAIAMLKDIVTSTAKRTYTNSEKGNRVLLLERLGVMYRTAEQFGPAIEVFRQIADIDPDMGGRAAVQVVETYRVSKELNKAETEAQNALGKYPDDRVLRGVYASVLADEGKSDAAIDEMKKLVAAKKDRETYISLSQVYEKAKRYPEMAQAIDEADKLSVGKDEKETIHFLRGAMYEKLKKYDEAEAEFRKVLEMNPQNASALNYLGYMFADRNIRLNEALQMITKALDREPGNPAYLDSLGWVYFRLGRFPEAETNLKMSLEKMAKDPTVHDHLGDVYSKQGKLKDAIAQWERSLKEWDATPPAEQEQSEIAKVHKKLEGAKVRLARETKP